MRFIKDFSVPFLNNEAERNLRSIKIKMNVSKIFGKIESAKKQNLNPLNVFIKIFNEDYEVFCLN